MGAFDLKMKVLVVFLAVSIANEIIPLETFIRVNEGEKSESIIAEMSRADSLFKLGDTRDLLYAMLHYRFDD